MFGIILEMVADLDTTYPDGFPAFLFNGLGRHAANVAASFLVSFEASFP